MTNLEIDQQINQVLKDHGISEPAWLPIHRLGEGMEANETEELDTGDEVRFVYLAGTLEGIIQADHQHGSDWHFQIVDRKGHNHPDVDMRRITHYRKA